MRSQLKAKVNIMKPQRTQSVLSSASAKSGAAYPLKNEVDKQFTRSAVDLQKTGGSQRTLAASTGNGREVQGESKDQSRGRRETRQELQLIHSARMNQMRDYIVGLAQVYPDMDDILTIEPNRVFITPGQKPESIVAP